MFSESYADNRAQLILHDFISTVGASSSRHDQTVVDWERHNALGQALLQDAHHEVRVASLQPQARTGVEGASDGRVVLRECVQEVSRFSLVMEASQLFSKGQNSLPPGRSINQDLPSLLHGRAIVFVATDCISIAHEPAAEFGIEQPRVQLGKVVLDHPRTIQGQLKASLLVQVLPKRAVQTSTKSPSPVENAVANNAGRVHHCIIQMHANAVPGDICRDEIDVDRPKYLVNRGDLVANAAGVWGIDIIDQPAGGILEADDLAGPVFELVDGSNRPDQGLCSPHSAPEPDPARPGPIMVDQTKLFEFVHHCSHVGVGVCRTVVAPAPSVSVPITRIAHPLATVLGADEIGDDGSAAQLPFRSALGRKACGCQLSVCYAGPEKGQWLITLHERVFDSRAAGRSMRTASNA